MSMMDNGSNALANEPGGAGSPDIVIQLQGIVQQLSALVQTFKAVFPQQGGTTSTATAGAATLPANPVGFMSVTLTNGTVVKMPYYNT
jgi:hypothetical protein